MDDRANDEVSVGDLALEIVPRDDPATGREDLAQLLIRLQFAADHLGTLTRKALIQLHCSEHRSGHGIGADREASNR